MDHISEIRERCHVNTNSERDHFVGIKANSDDIKVYFPIGYDLSDNDDGLRLDIHNLLSVLSTFSQADADLEKDDIMESDKVIFPIHAYMYVIRDFLRRNGYYYVETEAVFANSCSGRINWNKTIKRKIPLYQENGSLIFTDYIVRDNKPNLNKLITQIHKFCVYESFSKLGWLYVPFMPMPLAYSVNIKESIGILQEKINVTFNDEDRQLFISLLFILKYLDHVGLSKDFYFGTYNFEHVWEKMIDFAFGVKNKDLYFPHAKWILKYGKNKEDSPLIPDTVMIFKGKYYVIDSKYYKYGVTGNAKDLPHTSDINKQITYGEFLAKNKKIENKKLYNCFLIQFNKNENIFNNSNVIVNFGEAVGDWRYNTNNDLKNYERVQGLVIDTRFLMNNYLFMTFDMKEYLAGAIESFCTR